MHIRLTSHGVPRVRGAAARPDGCCRTSLRVACARLTLEWLLAPTLAARLCLPAAVCCSVLPSAAFSVARVEAMRARRVWAGAGERTRGEWSGEARRRRVAPLKMLRRHRRCRGARRLLRSRMQPLKRFRLTLPHPLHAHSMQLLFDARGGAGGDAPRHRAGVGGRRRAGTCLNGRGERTRVGPF